MVLHKRPLQYHVPLTCETLVARPVRSALDQLLSMHEARARIFGFGGTPCLASGSFGRASADREMTPYPNDHEDDWELAGVPVDSHIDVCGTLRRDIDVIRELCRLANVAVLENVIGSSVLLCRT